jgi:hypothetical protein
MGDAPPAAPSEPSTKTATTPASTTTPSCTRTTAPYDETPRDNTVTIHCVEPPAAPQYPHGWEAPTVPDSPTPLRHRTSSPRLLVAVAPQPTARRARHEVPAASLAINPALSPAPRPTRFPGSRQEPTPHQPWQASSHTEGTPRAQPAAPAQATAPHRPASLHALPTGVQLPPHSQDMPLRNPVNP